MKTTTLKSLALFALVCTLPFVWQSCTEGKGKDSTVPKGNTAQVPVRVVSLSKSTSSGSITASGKLSTDDETTLGFKTAGVVNAVFVKEGDQVKKGQLLATLDLTEVNAQASLARHNYEKAQRDFQRITNLYRDSVATLEQLQNTQTGLSIAKEQLDAANFNRIFSEIHAPSNGFVLRKFVNAGQVVSSGAPILMTNGAVKGKWVLKIGVSDKQWSSISVKDKATVKMDAFPDRIFSATVSHKSETSDPQTGTFTIELEVKNEDARLATGMFGAVEIQSHEALSSWSVPYEAVLDANGNEGFVFITNDHKTAIKQPVIIESFNGKNIRISHGLEDAKALIIAGSAYLSDHSPIQIIK